MRRVLGILAVSLIAAGCADTMQKAKAAVGLGPTAEAALKPTAGNTASGTVKFTQKTNAVLVQANVTGLKPGKHGIHIHEKGDCTAPDGASAGAHFNPSGSPHGGTTDPRHGGDLGNLDAAPDGAAKLELEVTGITVDSSSPTGIVGRGVIVHADPDDLKSQPAGNSGKRIACGAIALK